MSCRILGFVSVLGLCSIMAIAAQIAGPAFDVVSIHPVDPKVMQPVRSPDFSPFQPGGGFRDMNSAVIGLITLAYETLDDPQRHLLGLPKWAETTSYSVEAKSGPDFPHLSPSENVQQVRLMLRSLLTDRFHLRVHTEARPEKVLKLVVAKGGLKFKEVDPPEPPQQAGFTYGYGGKGNAGRLLGTETNMSRLAMALTIMLGQKVVDATELNGYYTFDVKWADDSPPDSQSRTGDFGTANFGSALVGVLSSQFGLKLERASVKSQFLIVDRIDPPDAE